MNSTPSNGSPSYSESTFACVYGQSGWGKTCDTLFSFPTAVFLADQGALKPWKRVVGIPFEPAYADGVHTIEEATDFIRQQGSNKNRRFTTIVLDDFSLKADRSLAVIEARFPKGGMPFWGAVRKALLDFRDAGREYQMHIVVNCHVRNPHAHEKKGWIMGGPALPGTMPEDFPKAVDICVRVMKEDTYPDWPFVFAANPRDTDYVQKTRLGEAADVLPMNTAELLRLDYGVEGPLGVPRIFDWQEKFVEKISEYLWPHALGSAEWKAVCLGVIPQIREKAKATANGSPDAVELQTRWTMRDAVARALLKQLLKKDRLSAYTM